MRTFLTFLQYCFIALSLSSTVLFAQPQLSKTNGPEGGDITDIKCVDDNIILVTTKHGGFFISFDGGDFWHQRNNGIKPSMPGLLMLFCVEYVNGFVFVGSNQHGIFRSGDLGENFEQVNTGIPTGPGLKVTKIVSNSEGDLFAVIPGHRIRRSLNNGNSWQETGPGIPDLFSITDITISDSTSNLAKKKTTEGKIFVSTNSSGVFKSTDMGNSFSPNNNGLTNLNINTVKSRYGITIAGSTTGAHRWNNVSNSWINVDGLPAGPVKAITIISDGSTDEINVVATNSSSSQVYGSSNNGVSWILKRNSRATNNPVLTNNNSFVFYGDHFGLQRQNISVNQWEEKNKGLTAVISSKLDFASDGAFYTLSTDQFDFQQSALYKTTDFGLNWNRFAEFDRGFTVHDFKYPYAVGYQVDLGGIFSKFNENTNEFDILYTNANGPYYSIAQHSNNIVTVGLPGTLKTTDGGNTVSTNAIWGYDVGYNTYREEWFLAGATGIKTSLDGLNWGAYITNDFPRKFTFASDGYVGYRDANFMIKGLTENNTVITLSSPAYGWQGGLIPAAIGFDNENKLWAGTYNFFANTVQLLYFDFYNGNVWEEQELPENLNTAIFDINFRYIFLQKKSSGTSDLFIATAGSGVWRFGEPTNVENDVSHISSFTLYQNYPNPFNPSTTISWQSPVGSWQTLKVYDLLGREVATLVDEYKEAGRHSIEFDASSLSSGVYFYKLQAGDFFSTKKLILMK